VAGRKIILVQPAMGVAGEFVRHPPLSLLYVASGLVKKASTCGSSIFAHPETALTRW